MCVFQRFEVQINVQDSFKKDLKFVDKFSQQLIKGSEDLFKKGGDDNCQIIWEEHQQPHCSTSYEKVSSIVILYYFGNLNSQERI